MRRQSDGFSLVEVIIAIAVLAMLAMSLLLYFSSANRYAGFGKAKQRADMAAQSVVEELASYTNYEQIEKNLIEESDGTWEVKSTPSPSKDVYSLLRTGLKVDDIEYDAKVTLDFNVNGTYKPASTQAPAYNDYKAPQIEKVYSENNVVLEETDQTEVAVADIFYQVYDKNKSIKEENIRQGLSRKLSIDIDSITDKLYLVRGQYEYSYTYNGNEYTCTTPIKDVKIESDALKKVYLFYKLTSYPSDDNPVMDKLYISGDDVEKFSYYIILQKDPNVVSLNNYQLVMADTIPSSLLDEKSKNRIYKNITNSGFAEDSDGLIVRDKKQRIADVTVDIYHKGESDSDDGPIVTVHTSKGA